MCDYVHGAYLPSAGRELVAAPSGGVERVSSNPSESNTSWEHRQGIEVDPIHIKNIMLRDTFLSA